MLRALHPPHAALRMAALIAAALLSAAARAGGGTRPQNDLERLEQWRAGSSVSAESVAEYGTERCFAVEEISDALFARMYGRSYKEECTVPREELRYVKLLHRDLEGRIRLGEIVCAASVARDLVEIFRALYDLRYPIERMLLVDDYDADDERSMRANNSSGFNFRRIAGSDRLSSHSRGRAVDINPLYNPCVRRRRDGSLSVSPSAARPYAERSARFPYKIDKDDPCVGEFKKRGFEWGGDWNSLKDYQHFEKP